MSQYQRILLIADPKMVRTPAFERAAWIARTTKAALHIALFDHSAAIAAWTLVDPKSGSQARDAWLQTRHAWLESEAQVLRGHGIKATAEAVWVHPVADEILIHISEYQPDLVIKDVRHEPLLKRVLLTPVDWQLLRDCRTPVLLVNSLAHPAPRRIFAAVDSSQLAPDSSAFNDDVIKAALALALQSSAELHLAASFDCLMMGVGTLGGDGIITPAIYETLAKLHSDGFAEIAKAHGVPPERAHLLAGPAPRVLAELAGNSATDVLVVGTHRRHGVDRLLMGSISEVIVDTANCDVLVIKPQGTAIDVGVA